LRSLVAGLASGSPDYDKLSPRFAEVVRRDLPRTHPMFSEMGELKSVTFRGRGAMGDDAYTLVFAKGEVIMSAALDAEGRMDGGMFRMAGPLRRQLRRLPAPRLPCGALSPGWRAARPTTTSSLRSSPKSSAGTCP
jgi:hypothetical protein